MGMVATGSRRDSRARHEPELRPPDAARVPRHRVHDPAGHHDRRMATAPGGDTAPGKLAGRPGPCAGEERRVSLQRPARAEATMLLRFCVVGLLSTVPALAVFALLTGAGVGRIGGRLRRGRRQRRRPQPRLDVPRQRARHGDRHAVRGGPGARGSGAVRPSARASRSRARASPLRLGRRAGRPAWTTPQVRPITDSRPTSGCPGPAPPPQSVPTRPRRTPGRTAAACSVSTIASRRWEGSCASRARRVTAPGSPPSCRCVRPDPLSAQQLRRAAVDAPRAGRRQLGRPSG
jgi:hypothetical protein